MADKTKDPLYLAQYNLHGKTSVLLERKHGGYRICGPKMNGQQRLVARAHIDARDQQNIVRMLDNGALYSAASTAASEAREMGLDPFKVMRAAAVMAGVLQDACGDDDLQALLDEPDKARAGFERRQLARAAGKEGTDDGS